MATLSGATRRCARAVSRRASIALGLILVTVPYDIAARPAASFAVGEPPLQTRRGVLQCVPYARQVSGIQLYGDAHYWWGMAAGQYRRGHRPKEGAVLAFRSTGAMPGGHVAMVSDVLDDRRVLLDHANWSGPGVIEHDVLAQDISPGNDWSEVRVWYGPIGKLGSRSNPTYGFIYPQPDRGEPDEPARNPGLTTIASGTDAPRKAKSAPKLGYDKRVYTYEAGGRRGAVTQADDAAYAPAPKRRKFPMNLLP